MKNKQYKTSSKITFVLVLMLLLAGLGFNLFFSIPYYKMNNVMFQNLDNLHLSAKYRSSDNGKGVIIATDLAHDKSELTSLIYELDRQGYGIYIFDFPSQGQSEGNIPFNSENNKYIAEQFYDAVVSYSQLENMSVSNIHVIAYGTGARAALQTVSLGFLEPASLTLIGTEINFYNKIQYNILDYTLDSETDWITGLSERSYSFPIQIISSNLDEVSTSDDNQELVDLLDSENNLNNISYDTVSYSPHYLLMNSISIIDMTMNYLSSQDGYTYQFDGLLHYRYLCLPIIFLCLLFLIYRFGKIISPHFTQVEISTQKLPKHYFRNKAIILLPSLLFMVAIPILLYLLPINYPYNDIFRLSLFVSYGVLMFLLYKFTNFGENIGQHLFANFKLTNTRGGLFVGLILFILILAVSFSGMYSLLSYKSKWLWIIIFTILCFFAFFIDEKERRFYIVSTKQKAAIFVLNYGLVFLSPIILIVIGLYNTALMCLIMIGYLIFATSIEWLFIRINSPIYLNALIKAFLFQLLVFAQTTMFLN